MPFIVAEVAVMPVADDVVGVGIKIADKVLPELIVTAQVPEVLVQAPLQPMKV